MTLKEKFNIISCKDCDMPFCDIKCTMLSDWELNKLEKIADDYAIEFGEWLLSRATGEEGIKLRDDILEIFKKENGL